VNVDRLHAAEADFLGLYPEGFRDPGLAAIGRRHNVDKLTAQAQEAFRKPAFARTANVIDDLVRIVGRSSMVSMFEKPKFRDAVAGMDSDERAALADALKRMLHGTGASPRRGFETMVDLLLPARLAKWSLVTCVPYYVHPDAEVFVKPTTAKGVIDFFELDVPPYRPVPYWAFYTAYREKILEMKGLVRPELAPNNAAFSGFLMMTMKGLG
jgi:hypothetical protein